MIQQARCLGRRGGVGHGIPEGGWPTFRERAETPQRRRKQPGGVPVTCQLAYGDPAMGELAAARDSDELCRLLVQSPWGWGSSTRHGEAVSLLRGLRGGTLPGSLVALLLCTCRRWDRVTAKLIAAVEECGVLSGPDLDELAESLVSDEVVAVFPLAWISGQWLELGTADGTTRTVQVSDEAVARDERRVEPPLRRWAAARALRNDPARLEELLERADGMPPGHRDAFLHGLLDAADGLDAARTRRLVSRALRSGIARVRRAALDRLCELDGPEAALRRARADADRTVRAWRPPGTPAPAQPQLPGIAL